MYIICQDDSTQHNWWVGSKKPRQKDGNCFDDVREVYADGPELAVVRRRCINIPDVPTAGFMVWKPPFAQFIYDTLIYEPVVVHTSEPPEQERQSHESTTQYLARSSLQRCAIPEGGQRDQRLAGGPPRPR